MKPLKPKIYGYLLTTKKSIYNNYLLWKDQLRPNFEAIKAALLSLAIKDRDNSDVCGDDDMVGETMEEYLET